MASDLDQLLEMGFDPEKAKLAVKKTGGRESPDAQDQLRLIALLTRIKYNLPSSGSNRIKTSR